MIAMTTRSSIRVNAFGFRDMGLSRLEQRLLGTARLLRFHFEWGENELLMWEHSKQVMIDLFKAAGQDLDALTQAASSRDFQPVPLGVKLTGNVVSKLRSFNTTNVVAKLAGRDPKLVLEIHDDSQAPM